MNSRWNNWRPYVVAWTAAVLAVFVLLLVTRQLAQGEWRDNEHATRRELSNLSRLTQEHASRTMHAADQALQLIRVLYQREGLALDLGELARQGAIDVSIVHLVGIIDAQGMYRLSNLPQTPRVDLSDREHFKVHVNGTADTLFISKPMLGRVSQKWTIQLTRRISRPDGSFAGVAVVSVNAEYFADFYASLDLGASGAAALIGHDGVVRVRRSKSSSGMAITLVNKTPALEWLARGQTEGFFENTSAIDQVARLHHFRAVPGYPLYVTVAVGLQDYRTPAQEAVRVDWLQAALGSALLLGFALLFSWHRARDQAQYRALAHSHEKMNLALDGGGLGLWEWELDSGRFTLDERLLALLGYAPGELRTDNTTFIRWLHPDDVGKLREVLPPVLRGDVPRLLLEHRWRHKDGHWVWLMARGTVVARDASGRALRLMGTDVDRTAQKQAEALQSVAAVAFESSSAMVVSDARQRVLRVNPAFVALTGYSVAEAVGQPAGILKSGRHDAAFYALMWDSINQTGHWEGEIWNRQKNGEVFLDWLAITVVKDAQGQVTHYVSVHVDITLRKRSEDEIRKLAFFDPLTNLPNRRLLLDRLQQLGAARARNSQMAAVLFIDLDHFKQLNDTHGHDQGDDLLIQVAQRLQACVREVDTVARLGGDEFVVALAQLGDDATLAQASALTVAQKILAALSARFVLPHAQWELSASMGVVLLSDAKVAPEDLLKQADDAMYTAKAAGRNAVRVWHAPD